MKTFRLFDYIGSYYTNKFAEFLQAVEQGERIQVEITSYGGDIFAGLAIAEMLIGARQRNIHSTVYIYGVAASAAAIISLAANHVVMTDVGTLMLHSVFNSNGEEDDDGVDRANEACLAIIQKRCPSYTMETLLDGDHWYTAEESKSMGLIDEIRPLTETEKIPLQAVFRGMLTAAVHAAKPKGGWKMGTKTNEVETTIEKQVEEQEREVEKLENEEEETAADDLDIKTLIIDGFSAVLDRLDAIEARIMPAENTANDEDTEQKDEDIMSAKMKALYDRIGRVSGPTVKKTRDDGIDDSATQMKAAAERVKRVFPNIAKYYAE